MIFEKAVVEKYKAMTFARCDDTGVARYFAPEDFAGLRWEICDFKSSAGLRLRGYIYSYDNPAEDRLIIFDHGLGGGHRSYMKEIELLCRHGWRVFSYDHTGCMESEGEGTNGLSQSLSDLNDCISFIKADERFAGCTLSVVGHSWGAFAAMNICALHPDVTHIVAMCGFVTVEKMVESFFGGMLKGYRRPVMRLERETNPVYVNYNSAESLSNTDAKVLLIYSDNDPLCRRELHYDALRSALAEKENVTFLLEHSKGHNPNYTVDAVSYLAEYTDELKLSLSHGTLKNAEDKAAFVRSFDWERMTAQDDAVWEKIFAHLES